MADARWKAELVPQPEKPDVDSEEAWQLDSSIAIVLPPPASIYSAQRPDHHDRWEALLTEFERELLEAARQTPGFEDVVPVREHYRTTPLTPQGGPYSDVTEQLLTLMRDVHTVVQGLSGWLTLASFAPTIAELWKRVRFRMQEHDDSGEWPKLPLLSLPFIKAMCIKDMVERYNIREVPSIAVDTRPTETGGQRHPTGQEHHILTAVLGTEVVQRLVWIASSQGICREKFLLLDGPPLEVQALAVPQWVSPHSILAV